MSGLTKITVNLTPAAEAALTKLAAVHLTRTGAINLASRLAALMSDLAPEGHFHHRPAGRFPQTGLPDLTWQQHQPGGNTWQPGICRQCTPDGCPQLAWATGVREPGSPAEAVN